MQRLGNETNTKQTHSQIDTHVQDICIKYQKPRKALQKKQIDLRRNGKKTNT